MHKKFFRETSRFFNFSLRGFKEGYLLPVVLILGLVLTSLGTFGLAIITSNSTNISNQIYGQLANDAAQAGLVAAQTCLSSSSTSSSTTDADFSKVSMLVETSGTSGQNKTFVDSSSLNATVASYGNPTQGSFGPNSSSNSVRINVNENAQESVYVSDARMAIGTSDFTVEAWVYLNANTGVVATSRWASSQYNNYWLMGVSNGRPYFLTRGNTGDANGNGFYTDWGANSTTSTLSTGQWYHMAGVRQSGVLKLYIDGQLMNVTQSDNNVNLVETAASIGFFNYAGYTAGFNGFVSNFRMVDGTAVYTSNFTPPTTVSDVTNTKLLLNMKNAKIYDGSNNANLRTIGNVAASGTQSKFGGSSVYFDGSGSYLTGSNLSKFNLGTGDFTIETWYYQISNPGNWMGLVSLGTTGGGKEIRIGSIGGGNLGWLYPNNTNNGDTYAGLATNPSFNTWHHVAFVRSGSNMYFFVDGVQLLTATGVSFNFTTPNDLFVGATPYGSDSRFPGYVDELRITKGTARYTSNFTPPTVEFPATSANPIWTSVLTPASNCTGSVAGSTKSPQLLNDTARKVTTSYEVAVPCSANSGATTLISTGKVFVNGVEVSKKVNRTKLTGLTVTGGTSDCSTSPPTYASIGTASGGAGASITLTGTNFVAGGTTVTIGGVSVTPTVNSKTSLTFIVPDLGTSGAKDITIGTGLGTVTAPGVFYYYGAPTFSTASPSSVGTGTSVTLTGTNFVAGSTTVTVGGVSATTTYNSTTSLTITVPSQASSGAKNVTITTPYGSATGVNALTFFNPPTYTSISPASGLTGTTATVTGTGFVGGSTTATVDGVAATVTVNSSTSLSITIPSISTSGAKNVTITTPYGSATGTGVFTYTAPPTISSFSPGSLWGGTSGNITINGNNFVSGSTTVTVNGSSRSVTFNSATSLTVAFPALSRGSYTVSVTTPYGTASAGFPYVITPSLSSMSPANPTLNQNTTFTLYGSNFISSGATGVYTEGAGYQYKGWTVINDSTAQFNATYDTAGGTRLIITAPDGWSNWIYPTVVAPAPTFSSISPSEGITGKTATITGSNFSSGTTVTIGGVAAATTINSSTSLTVTIPSIGSEGAQSVVVSNAGGSASGSYTYWFTRSPQTTAWVGAVGVATYYPPSWANRFDMVVLGGGGGGETGGAGFRDGRGGGAGSWNAANIGRVYSSYYVRIPLGGAGGAESCTVPDAGGTAQIDGIVSASGGAIYAMPLYGGGGSNGGSPGSYTFNGVTYSGGTGGARGTGSPYSPAQMGGYGAGGGGGGGFLLGACTFGGSGGYANVWIRAYQNY